MSAYQFDTIFTLDARSHMFLEVSAEHFKLTDQMVFNLIQGLFQNAVQILAKKDIKYENLRRALVPSIDRHERALVFDYTKFATSFYGRDVIHSLLPHLSKDSTHSILCGDWLHDGIFHEWLKISSVAQGTLDLDRANVPYQTLYFVYVNNLSAAGATKIDRAFQSHPAYLGCLDLNRATPLKAYLSTCLVRDFIKHRGMIIKGHEDDRDPTEDVNLSLFDFEKFGLKVRSLPATLYGVFLSYKIERLALPSELDRKFALSAITSTPSPIDDFQLILEENKLKYLRENKAGSIKRLGFNALSPEDIGAQIRSKIDSSYIYNLARATNGDTLKFNVLLESDSGVRAECALEYRLNEQSLRVITLY